MHITSVSLNICQWKWTIVQKEGKKTQTKQISGEFSTLIFQKKFQANVLFEGGLYGNLCYVALLPEKKTWWFHFVKDSYAPRGEDVEVHPEQQDSFGYSNISETFEILGNHWLHTSFLWRHPLQSWSVYLASLGISFTLSKKVNREGFGG